MASHLNKSPTALSLAAFSLAVLVIAGCGKTQGSAASDVSLPSSSITPATLEPLPVASAQLSADLTSALTARSLPAVLTPSLNDFVSTSEGQSLTGPASFAACDAYGRTAQQANPSPCELGDVHSAKVVVIVGDSNVGNWVPALDLGMRSAGYKLDVFGFAGCLTPDLIYTSSNDGNTDPDSTPTACNTWHTAVASAIRAVRPIAVIADAAADNYDQISPSEWISGMDKLFAETAPAGATRILMGTSPYLNEAAPTCLSTHPNPHTCSISYVQGGAGPYNEYLTRDSQIAASAKAKLIAASQWLCQNQVCPPVIGNYLVYGDTDHLTISFSQFIAPEVSAAVLSAIHGS